MLLNSWKLLELGLFLVVSNLQAIVSALSIFDSSKVQKVEAAELSTYGEEEISTLLAHYGEEKPAETLLDEPTKKLSSLPTLPQSGKHTVNL